ncbi:MAG: SseB family protein, partial [Gammaproteobacteria bacterium]|nr:SseB family protein [Gammaproteobacteria bacterium]
TEIIILFTSPERAKEFVRDYPGFGGGLLAEMSWILEKIGSGHGISINPNWPTGIDMEPGMVDSLRK